ncbi:MAG: PIG-L family deacetylase [Anaerolineaceae bacterium]|nr:PIG-L family deacetylase [Anaerolineaceae bacterium]
MMKVLVIFAHPDDETMLCGGTLALLRRQGAEIHYLAATRGEGGEAGEPPLCSREELGAVRTAELSCAVQALGGGGLEFMGYQDPAIGPDNTLYSFTSDLKQFCAGILQVIQRVQPDAVLTHGSNGEYGHPAHKTVHQSVLRVLKGMPQPPVLYTFQAMFEGHPKPRLMNRTDRADFVLDITPVLEQKTQASLCHRTQHALFVRNASRDAGRLLTVSEIVVKLESLRRRVPAGRPIRDDLAALLRASGCILQERQ